MSEVTFGTYYVRPEAQDAFEGLMPRNWDTLQRLGFIANDRPQLYRSVAGPLRYIELTRWVPGVMGPAHEHPDVIPIWSLLASCVEPYTPDVVDRGLVFDEFEPVSLAVND